MSDIEGKQHPLEEVFKDTYEIPSFQRPYSWTEKETLELFEDLYNFWKDNGDNEENYFLGCIVLGKEKDNTSLQVIDGQQRITTLTMLFAVIALKFPDYQSFVYQPTHGSNKAKSRLRMREGDDELFREYIQEEKFDELLAMNKPDVLRSEKYTDAQRNIIRNASLLYEKVKDLFTADELESFAKFLETRCFMVSVVTNGQDMAFRVFLVLNTRGMDLSYTDILKADIVGQSKELSKKWDKVEKLIGRSDFTNFFATLRMIFQKKEAKVNILDEFRNDIIPLLPSKESFVDDFLIPYAEAYLHVKGRDTNSPDENIRWLNRLEHSDWVPAAMLYYHKNKSNPNALRIFFKKLERLSAFILSITGRAFNIHKRIARYSSVLKEIDEAQGANYGNSIELTEDEKKQFIDVLGSNFSNGLYFLKRIDSFRRIESDVIYGYGVCSIEHVLPQTIANTEWAKIWTKAEHEEWLDKLGNLILLEKRLNSSARNKSLTNKKEAYKKHGVSSYAMAVDVLSASEWTPKVVKKRHEELLKLCRDKWELN